MDGSSGTTSARADSHRSRQVPRVTTWMAMSMCTTSSGKTCACQMRTPSTASPAPRATEGACLCAFSPTRRSVASGTASAKSSMPIDTNQLCTIGQAKKTDTTIRRRPANDSTKRGYARAPSASTTTTKSFAAIGVPTTRPTRSSHVKSAELVLKRPLKTSSGYAAGCWMTVMAARWLGRSWNGGIATSRTGHAARTKRTALSRSASCPSVVRRTAARG